MTYYGKTITELRKRQGMTQAELGAALNVTYQAVSKWENDQSQPGVEMLAGMCKIFNVTMDEFVKMAESGEFPAQEEALTAEPVVVQQSLTSEETASIVREELARAKEEERQEKARQITEKKEKERQRQEAIRSQENRTAAGWFRFGMIMSIIFGVGVGVALALTTEVYIGIISGILVFMFGMHMGHDCFIFDFFVGSWLKSIHMPGIIFSLDLNGILFFIAYKLIIAPIISFLLGLVIGIGGTILAILMSPFSFLFKFPALFKAVITGEED